jgi:hypothetical protein
MHQQGTTDCQLDVSTHPAGPAHRPSRSSSPVVALGPTANAELTAVTRIPRPTASVWCNPPNADFEIFRPDADLPMLSKNLLITQPTEYKIQNSNIAPKFSTPFFCSVLQHSNPQGHNATSGSCSMPTVYLHQKDEKAPLQIPPPPPPTLPFLNVKMWLLYFCDLHGARFIDF